MRRAIALLFAALLAGAAAPTSARGWDRYQAILWHTADATPASLAAARRAGVTAGLVFGERAPMPPADLAAELRRRAAPLLAAGLRPYVENIATDFYSAYHRWRPDRPVGAGFDDVQAWHGADPADPSVFFRDPGLSDPAALAGIAARLAAHARALGAARPLFYSLGDETGIADLSAAWDFDRSPDSLAGFRAWLGGEYGSLGALNREWGTGFADWDAVTPLPTAAALALTDGNFAAWADFRAWMDTAFARALRAGTDALHGADPAANSGIEGAQVPGTGGYDYTKLAAAVDVLEISGGDPGFAVAHALNPDLALLTTAGGGGAATRDGLWRALLGGARGVVLWHADLPALAPLLAEFEGPLGTALLAARPLPGPVAILYSPASDRTAWILDRRADAARGQDWARRRAATELEDTAGRVAMRQASGTLAHLGFEPRWLSPARLAGGALRRDGVRVLLLAHVLALSDAERAELHAFQAAGGLVLADLPPGGYDEHSRRRAAPADGAVLLPAFDRATLGPALAAAGVAPGLVLAHPDGGAVADVTARVLRRNGRTILGLQRDRADEGGTEQVVLTLPRPRRLRDLRTGAARTTDRLTLRLPAATPTVLEIDPE